MAVKIREATEKDLTKILELNHKLFLFEKSFAPYYNSEWPFKEGKSYFKKRIKNKEEGIVLVCEVKNKVVGYIAGYIDEYSFRTLNPIAEVENMYVEENFRGKGIGTKLIKKFIKLAKDKGAKLVKVSAFCKNTSAQRFYKHLGFSEVETVMEKVITSSEDQAF